MQNVILLGKKLALRFLSEPKNLGAVFQRDRLVLFMMSSEYTFLKSKKEKIG